MFNQLHFRSTAAGFKTYSPSLPTIALLDGLLEQANSQNPCRQLVTKHQMRLFVTTFSAFPRSLFTLTLTHNDHERP